MRSITQNEAPNNAIATERRPHAANAPLVAESRLVAVVVVFVGCWLVVCCLLVVGCLVVLSFCLAASGSTFVGAVAPFAILYVSGSPALISAPASFTASMPG